MLKKVITYQNPFTEQEVSEEHYFHISKADLVEMEMEEHNVTYVDKDGKTLTGMQAKLQRIVDSEDGKAIMFELKDMIRRSFGKKDGDRFIKTKTNWDDFVSTEAFSQLLFELCTDANASAEFMNGVIPSNLEQIAAEVRKKAEEDTGPKVKNGSTNGVKHPEADPTALEPPAGLTVTTEPVKTEARLLSTDEIVAMEGEELKSGLATGRYRLS